MDEKDVVKAAIRRTIGKRGKPSQYRLAQELGVSEPTVSDWKAGRKRPNSTHLLRLLQIAGKLTLAVSLSALLTSSPTAHAATNATSSTLYIMLNRIKRFIIWNFHRQPV